MIQETKKKMIIRQNDDEWHYANEYQELLKLDMGEALNKPSKLETTLKDVILKVLYNLQRTDLNLESPAAKEMLATEIAKGMKDIADKKQWFDKRFYEF